MTRRVISTVLVVLMPVMGLRLASGQTRPAGDRQCTIVVTDATSHAPIEGAAVRAAADKLRMNWAQWILKEDMIQFSMDWDFGQQQLGLVLIDPRGRLISLDLKGDAAEETVARVLAGRSAR